MGAIDNTDVKYGGMRFRLDLDHDTQATPMDYDCYSEDAVARWTAGGWQFVVVTIRPEIGGFDLGPHFTLGAVEFGDSGEWSVSLANIVEQAKEEDWFGEAVSAAKASEWFNEADLETYGRRELERIHSAVMAVLDRYNPKAGRPCGQGWVAEIALCPRCGLSAAEHKN